MRTFRSIAGMLIAGALSGACLDLSPVPFEGPEGGWDGATAVVIPDASSGDAAGGECEQCLKSSCASPATACERDPKCAKAYTCFSATQCWGSSLTDLSNLSPCLIQCSLSAGITGQEDPVTAFLSPLFVCAQDPRTCAGACLGSSDR